jgi:GNAT superfamily N-acetyltransferase
MQENLQRFLEQAPWSCAYVAAKVVEDEPLCQLLTDAGFEQVEHRCLFKSNVSDPQISRERINNSVQYQSLAAISADQRDRVREQILEICKEGFQQGYSRHFADGFLLQRAAGLTYILDVMKLNFERVPLHLFLLALDTGTDRLCGFSILSERPGSGQLQYTQLLSAVRKAYRGKGVYAGLTRLLAETLPNESQLLNVTLAENHAMRRAYQTTGRLHYADTLVLRRIFGSAARSGTD